MNTSTESTPNTLSVLVVIAAAAGTIVNKLPELKYITFIYGVQLYLYLLSS